jgi:hypothetical protein
LAVLNRELREKQRLIVGLNSGLKSIDKKTAAEIYNRDRYIDDLNQKILEASAEKIDAKLTKIR